MWSQHATAKSGNFLGLVGTSTLIGTVVGASTLPFYQEPKDHYGNILIGAAMGAVVGLGFWIYGLIKGDDEEEYYFYGVRHKDRTQRSLALRSSGETFGQSTAYASGESWAASAHQAHGRGLQSFSFFENQNSYQPTVWMPVLSLTL